MRNRKITLLALIVFGCGVLLALNRYATAKPTLPEETKRKWEYCYLFRSQLSENHYKAQMTAPDGRTIEIDSSYMGVGALNKLGAEGWDLVAIIPDQSMQANAEYILKRPKP